MTATLIAFRTLTNTFDDEMVEKLLYRVCDLRGTYADCLSWNGSNQTDPASASVVVTSGSPRQISPAHSVSSQISVNSTTGNEKPRCDQSGNPNSWIGFAKLARFLNQREKDKASNLINKNANCRRTHSLENEDLPIRRATSIDSLVVDSSFEANNSVGHNKESGKSIPPSPSFPSRLERPFQPDLQSSPSLHTRVVKNRSGWSRESIDCLVDGLSYTKADRKKMEKINKINIHMHALFLAVEQQQLEKARTIMENVYVDLDSVNGDGFNALDIAVLTQNVSMAKLLLSYGAKENTKIQSYSTVIGKLANEAEKKIENLTTSLLNVPTTGPTSATQVKGNERQLLLWERRCRLMKKMQMGFEQTRPPDCPSLVTLHVASTDTLRVEIEEPDCQTGAIVTRFRVEWSQCEMFEPLTGSIDIYDLRTTTYSIKGLESGLRYYVRVMACNIKGCSSPKVSCPASAVPSVWRDVDGRPPRSAGRLSVMEDLFNQIKNSRPEYASEIKGIADQIDTPAQQRKIQMKKSIKNLFTPAPKFFKHLKRGVFLAAVMYNEDRVLVTTEDFLPVVEVDETYPNTLHTDFHWVMKVACTWDDVKSLRQDMDKSLSSSTVHFRSRLLQAAAQLQTALGVHDLGQFFYKPLKDSFGTIVISTICHVKDVKAITALSMRWVPITKLLRKVTITSAETAAGDLLLSSMSEQIQYSQMSSQSLRRGLYLGYLKTKSSMDLIRVLVPEKTPNVPPHYKIRDNPHISCEEWEWFTAMARYHSIDCIVTDDSNEEINDSECCDIDKEENVKRMSFSRRNTLNSCLSEVQLQFGRQLFTAVKHLFSLLKINKEEALLHRIYDVEVIELSQDVSFLLILPSVEKVCLVPGLSDEFTTRVGFISLPVQIFEMIHMSTYQRDFISRYSRLSSILEMDTIMAQHNHREAFSTIEVTSAKQRLCQLQEIQGQMDNTWKGMRWIMDVLTYARDRLTNGGIPVSILYDTFDIYSSVADSLNSCSRSFTPSPNLSLSSGRSMDSVKFLTFRELTKSTLRNDKRQCNLQVPIMSPVCKPRHWSKTVHGKNSTCNIPKSYSDTFTGLGIKDVTVTVSEASDSLCDLVSLTPSIRSVSSDELSTDDIPLQRCSSEGGNLNSQHFDLPPLSLVTKILTSDCEADTSGLNSRPISQVSSSINFSEPGVLRVYAAYETGLASGANVKLHVVPQTTAREVINLVVKQLSMAAVLKHKEAPVYTDDQLKNFCLVAVIGARERCLRDDFCPLKLQNPWTNGKLFVRMKNDVLAAIQHQNPDSSSENSSASEQPVH
ncbi:hypothetical protein CHUAL_011717 [Chamberlinius hualienensis]